MSSPSVVREIVANAPLPFLAGVMAFVDQYGSLVLFVLGVTFALAQFVWRRREHKKIMGGK